MFLFLNERQLYNFGRVNIMYIFYHYCTTRGITKRRTKLKRYTCTLLQNACYLPPAGDINLHHVCARVCACVGACVRGCVRVSRSFLKDYYS